MVKRAELLSGGFPAEYGGRVSSVLNVESDAGTGDWQVDGGLSLLAARLAVAGGAPDGLTKALGFQTIRWRLSGRRSYFDQFTSKFPYHLTDGQGIFEAWTEGGSRLQLTGYSGRDVLDLSETTSGADSLDIPFEIDWRWGNDAIGARWTSPRGGWWFHRGQRRDTRDSRTRSGSLRTTSTLARASRCSGADSRSRSVWAGVGGFALERTSERLRYTNLLEAGGATFQDVGGQGWLHGGFLSARWGDARWLVEAGARLDYWTPEVGTALWEPAPRLAIKRFLGDRSSAIKLAAGRYTQFLHSLRDEQLPFGIDTWVSVGTSGPSGRVRPSPARVRTVLRIGLVRLHRGVCAHVRRGDDRQQRGGPERSDR